MPEEEVIMITNEDKEEAEAQIVQHHKIVDYDTREYPVEVIVDKYIKRLEEDDNDFFIPDYQRDLTWTERNQSRFIESVLMGLPIPLLFLADVSSHEGRAEIVDGSQRVRTLARFMNNELRLSELERLTKLNGFTFSDLTPARQRRFGRHTLRMIELREGTDEDTRRDIFGRINTGSIGLNDMERRWGANDGPFLQFIKSCSMNELFSRLAPLGEQAIKRREPQEFVLRFFAYLRDYQKFDRMVVEFLNKYLDDMKSSFDLDVAAQMQLEWERMLVFVDEHFPHGFTRGEGHVRTPRIRFEAISVGTALALREKPDLRPLNVDWIDSNEFKQFMRSDASNSRPKIIRRIEFVRDQLLRAHK